MFVRNLMLAGLGCAVFSVPSFATTLKGGVVYRDADGQVATKTGEIEFDEANIASLKLKLAGVENLSEKVKFKKFDGENRTLIAVAFKGVREMPEGTTLLIKASVLKGKNGSVAWGDLYTRTCKPEEEGQGSKDPADDDEDSLLQRLVDRVEQYEESSGCEIAHRGGIALSTLE